MSPGLCILLASPRLLVTHRPRDEALRGLGALKLQEAHSEIYVQASVGSQGHAPDLPGQLQGYLED